MSTVHYHQSQLDLIDTERFFSLIQSSLDERSRRLVAAAIAESGGRTNLSHVARCASVSRPVIYRGLADLHDDGPGVKANGERRQRNPGGGRHTVLENTPEIADRIRELIEPHVRGSPESPLRWVSKSLAKIRASLAGMGYTVCRTTIGGLLRMLGYTLQSCKKALEHCNSPDRDAQFRHIAAMTAEFVARCQPVISVDTKKKELVGNFKNAGRDYRPSGEPVMVEEHDFATEDGKATPYGVFDIANNEAFVNVGLGPDTAEFAVESIEKWWTRMGRARHPNADRLYITADGGGSNGSRCRLWKLRLQGFATRYNLAITVSHYPPGTSKWNKIEHMVFSFITQNWRGTPLTSVEIIVNLIAHTTNSKGLRVVAEQSKSNYAKGVKVSDEEMKAINICGDVFHPEWNYTINP